MSLRDGEPKRITLVGRMGGLAPLAMDAPDLVGGDLFVVVPADAYEEAVRRAEEAEANRKALALTLNEEGDLRERAKSRLREVTEALEIVTTGLQGAAELLEIRELPWGETIASMKREAAHGRAVLSSHTEDGGALQTAPVPRTHRELLAAGWSEHEHEERCPNCAHEFTVTTYEPPASVLPVGEPDGRESRADEYRAAIEDAAVMVEVDDWRVFAATPSSDYLAHRMDGSRVEIKAPDVRDLAAVMAAADDVLATPAAVSENPSGPLDGVTVEALARAGRASLAHGPVDENPSEEAEA